MSEIKRFYIGSIFVFGLLFCAQAQHRILLGSYGGNNLMILGADNQIEWQMPGLKKVTDVQRMPDGQILVAHTTGISKITPDYTSGSGGVTKCLWRVPRQSDLAGDRTIPPNQQQGETHTCQLLPNGNILTGVSYDACSYVMELDFDGTICKKIRLPNYGTRHGSFRNIRKTPAGTYLLSRNGRPFVGTEIDETGRVLRKFNDGRYVLVRLPNENTLVAGSDAHRVYEVNQAGQIVWSLEQNEISGISLAAVCGIQRLPNGNTLISSWGGHGDLQTPAVIEVSTDKRLVWKTPDFIKNRVLAIQVWDENVLSETACR